MRGVTPTMPCSINYTYECLHEKEVGGVKRRKKSDADSILDDEVL